MAKGRRGGGKKKRKKEREGRKKRKKKETDQRDTVPAQIYTIYIQFRFRALVTRCARNTILTVIYDSK